MLLQFHSIYQGWPTRPALGATLQEATLRKSHIQLQYHALHAVCSLSVSVIYSVHFDVLLILPILTINIICTNSFQSFCNSILSVACHLKKVNTKMKTEDLRQIGKKSLYLCREATVKIMLLTRFILIK
jgi:hypothetical protein